MSKTSLFHAVNSHISSTIGRNHLATPKTPYRMIVDERANLIVCMTKGEYLEYLDSRDKELCTY
jgi:hypothetical protein